MSKAAAVQKVADGIRTEQGRLDILVNNAGINIPNRSWQQLEAEGIDTVIQGNLTSAFYVVQAVLPIMRAQERRRDDPHLVLGGPLDRAAVGPGLHRRQARHGGDEPHAEPRGGHERHPQLRALPQRGGDADPG